MIILLMREPSRVALLKDIEEDLRSFVLSLPMSPEELQKQAVARSDALLRQIASALQESGNIRSDENPTNDGL